MAKNRVELMMKDDAIRQIDVDVKEMQMIIEQSHNENNILKSENEGLRREIESMKGI